MRIIHVHIGDREMVFRDADPWANEPRKGKGPGGGEWTSGGGGQGGTAITAPKKTVTGYKQFRTLKTRPGEIFPLFIANKKPVPVGSWVPAENAPTKGFALRPGWHAGELPIGKQLRGRNGQRQEGRVWAEVSLPADRDWQSEVDKLPGRQLLDRTPEGGHYRFQEKSQGDRGTPWLIGGALKVNRLLSDPDVAHILHGAGRSAEINAETRGKLGFAGQGGGATFASPNIGELQIGQAVDALSSARQEAFESAANDVDRELGIAGEERQVIGAWTDGAENSTMMYAPQASLEQLRVSAAMKGMLGQQKAVLVFHGDPAGEHSLYSTFVPGHVADIHAGLLASGILNHTLAPAEGGANVYIADLDGSAAQAVSKYATGHGVEFEELKGAGEFIGAESDEGSDAEQRAAGAAAFQRVIDQAELAGHPAGSAGAIWGRLRDRWSARIAGQEADRIAVPGGPTVHVHTGDEIVWEEAKHPRGQPKNAGQFAKSAGGGAGPKTVIHVHHEGQPEQKAELAAAFAKLPPAAQAALTEAMKEPEPVEVKPPVVLTPAEKARWAERQAEAEVASKRQDVERAQGYIKDTAKTDPWNREIETKLEAQAEASRPWFEDTAKGFLAKKGEHEPDEYRPLDGGLSLQVYTSSGYLKPEVADENRWRTNRLAHFLQKRRTAQLLYERGITTFTDGGKAQTLIDNLWSDWKQSSASGSGALVQMAVRDELGARMNADIGDLKDEADLKAWADINYDEYGGYEGIKAAVRANWETSQYLLHKAGIEDVGVYRAVYIPLAVTRDWAGEWKGDYRRFPDAQIARNGALSTTLDREVANDWNGVGLLPKNSRRVIMRIAAPASAVVSLPAYGIGREHEVVLAGTSWNGWDVWSEKAPAFAEVPCCHD